MKQNINVYVDGGVYADHNLVTWAYIVERNGDVIGSKSGSLYASGNHSADVETAESEAMYQVIKDYISNKPDNYVMYSDSRSFIDKIENRCANATHNPHVRYIQESISMFKGSPLPVSFQVKWKARRSCEWMKRVDDLCHKSNYIQGDNDGKK